MSDAALQFEIPVYGVRLVAVVCLVCIDPPRITSLTLPAAELATAADSDRCLPAAPRLRQTSCMSLLLTVDGTDRRTDRRTPYCYVDAGGQKRAALII